MDRERDKLSPTAWTDAWRQWVRDDLGLSVPNEFIVGYLSRAVVDCLAKKTGKDGGRILMPTRNGKTIAFDRGSTRDIAITRRDFHHTIRKTGRRKVITESEIYQIPHFLENPRAVLWDNDRKSLLYLFDAERKYKGKLIVRIQHLKIKTDSTGNDTVNRLRIAGYFDDIRQVRGNLKSGQFVLLEGDVK